MMEFNWSESNPSAASDAAMTASKSVYAVVTPTGDEFELRNVGGVSLESSASAVSSAAPSAAAVGRPNYPYCGNYPTPQSFAAYTTSSSIASYGYPSYAATASSVPGYHHPKANHNEDGDDMMEAARALCFLKSLNTGCSSQQQGIVVDVAMKMMSSETKIEDLPYNQEGALLRSLDVTEDDATSDNRVITNSLDHPDRLAIDDDVDEVNKLHQYVRKDLLEIFVVPQISDSDSEDEDEDDDDEDYRATKKRKNSDPPSLRTTRAAAARRESFASAKASISAAASPPATASSSTQKNYPGRVGFRCVHCADCRRKSASKAAFFPLRLTNIYREVCAIMMFKSKCNNCKFRGLISHPFSLGMCVATDSLQDVSHGP